MKISTVFHAVQDDPGVYSISFECYYFCIRWIVQCTETRVKKHCQLIQLGQPDSLSVAEYLYNQDRQIQLQDTKIFSTNPDAWTSSSARPWWWSSIPAKWTGRMAWSCMGHGNFSFSPSESIGVIFKVVKKLTALFRTNVCVLQPCMPHVHLTSSVPHLEPPIFLLGILWCPYHPIPSVFLTFLFHLYPVAALCKDHIFYHFHPFRYHTIIIPTLLDLNLPAHLLLATAQHSSPSWYMWQHLIFKATHYTEGASTPPPVIGSPHIWPLTNHYHTFSCIGDSSWTAWPLEMKVLCLHNNGNHFPNNTASCLRRPKSLALNLVIGLI